MARIRTIKPSFFRHVALYDAEREFDLPLRIAFAGLWTCADREGRFKWEPRELKLDCLPHDDVDFSRVLDALATRGFVQKYACDGEEYGYIPSFTTHQIINNRESPSSLPSPCSDNILTREPHVDDACGTPLNLAQGEGNRNGREQEGKGREGENARASATRSPWPENKSVPEPWLRTAEGELKRLGFPPIDLMALAAKFQNHNAANPQPRTLTEWQACFQNWAINEAKTDAKRERAAANGQPRSLAASIFGE